MNRQAAATHLALTEVTDSELGQTGDHQTISLPETLSGTLHAVDANCSCYWLQISGHTSVVSVEGQFDLAPGNWICFGKESAPAFQGMLDSHAIGIVSESNLMATRASRLGGELFPGIGQADPSDVAAMLELWRRARRLRAAGPTTFNRAIRALLIYACANQQELHALVDRAPGRSWRKRSQVFRRLQRALLYVSGHSDRVVRAEEIAALTSYSTWALSKAMHHVYGFGIQLALFRARMNRASGLLQDTSLSITEIAGLCGFESSAAFARAFRQHHGMTATSFRASHAPTTASPGRGLASIPFGTNPRSAGRRMAPTPVVPEADKKQGTS